MTRTTFDLDDATHLRVIRLVFECSIATGRQAFAGSPGEHVFEILGRWVAINFPGLAVGRVQQTGALTWAGLSADGQHIEFTVFL